MKSLSRLLDRLAILMVLLAIAWALVPSSAFLRPISVHIGEDGRVALVRETPLWGVDADWRAEITILEGDDFECRDGGTAYYQKMPGDRVTYLIGDWALPCLAFGPPFIYRASWVVRLFGVIPLRPVRYSTTFEGERPGTPDLFILVPDAPQ